MSPNAIPQRHDHTRIQDHLCAQPLKICLAQGPWGSVNFTGAWAAQATGYICSNSSAWQQLQLHAVPGTQLLVDGTPAITTAADGAVEAFPRGPAVDGLALHWAAPGCTHVQLRMFEPPRCAAGHVEALAAPPAPTPPLAEVTMAYSNASVVLCGGRGCAQSLRVDLGRDARLLMLHVSWSAGALVQRVWFFDASGEQHGSDEWVCLLPLPLCCTSARCFGPRSGRWLPVT